MQRSDWHGVMPAITTPFTTEGGVDHEFIVRHVRWLVDAGCTAIVTPGSLGEGAGLERVERMAVWQSCVSALGDRAPVVAAIAAASTDEAIHLAEAAADAGCRGLMVLPPYLYQGTDAETAAHFDAILASTGLSCMLYNNPIAYGTDVRPDAVRDLAKRHGNLHAVKESSGDIRRMTAIRADLDDRLAIFVGFDDLIVEGVRAGATGWIAGLVNALPEESVRLFELARDGRDDEADALYRWFLPLLRLDTVPTFVQLIKLVQAEVGMGSEEVRAPRRPVEGAEREEALRIIRTALAERAAV